MRYLSTTALKIGIFLLNSQHTVFLSRNRGSKSTFASKISWSWLLGCSFLGYSMGMMGTSQHNTKQKDYTHVRKLNSNDFHLFSQCTGEGKYPSFIAREMFPRFSFGRNIRKMVFMFLIQTVKTNGFLCCPTAVAFLLRLGSQS